MYAEPAGERAQGKQRQEAAPTMIAGAVQCAWCRRRLTLHLQACAPLLAQRTLAHPATSSQAPGPDSNPAALKGKYRTRPESEEAG